MTPHIRSAFMLIAQFAIVAAVAALGSIATIQQVDGWYADAGKAPWSPPNWLFGPVWTVLYTLMAISMWLVWRTRERRSIRIPATLYVAQLVLNALWTPVFFGLYPVMGPAALWLAFAIIVALDIMVLATILAFRRVQPVAAWLLVPYFAWVLFATTLNAAVALLN